MCVFFTLGTALVKWKALSGVHVAQATSTEGNNSMAILNVGVSKGQATWEFTLDEDSQGGECTCFGAVSKPLVDFNYNSASAFMYRCYNGQLYGRNSAFNKEKVRCAAAAPPSGSAVCLSFLSARSTRWCCGCSTWLCVWIVVFLLCP